MLATLAGQFDAIIESYPPGYLDNLGVGYNDLSKINPHLVMTSITPYGQKGPYRDYPGDDYQGEGEIHSVKDINGDDTYPTPRAIQSATPESTAYDNSLEVSSVSSIQININYEDRVGIGVTFSDNIAISSAYVIYNFEVFLRIVSSSTSSNTRFNLFKLSFPVSDSMCF